MDIQVFENGKQSLEAITKAAANARKILIGVAYITKSGLDSLLPYFTKDDGRKIVFLCGIGDLNAHDPAALNHLRQLSIKKKLEFAIVPDAAGIFHPKFYFFDNGQTVDIFIGSPNLTGRAFSNNIECLVHISVSPSHPFAKECVKLFSQWQVKSKNPDTAVRHLVQFAERLKEAESSRLLYEQFLKGASPTIFEPTTTTFSSQDRVCALANNGFICDTNFSMSSFHIPIPSRLTLISTSGTKIKPSGIKTGNLVVVDGGKSIYWDLLNPKERQDLKKLAYSAGFGPQEFGFRTPWGFFVPEEKFPEWIGWMKLTDEKTQEFVQTSLKNILVRQTSINTKFKQEFQARFPKAKSAQVTEATLIVKESLAELKKSHQHERAFNPTWRPTMVYSSGQWLSTLDNSALSQYAEKMADAVFVNNLAEFAIEASRKTRASIPVLSQGAMKTTCESALGKAKSWNIYGDKKLQAQCDELDRIIKRMPGTRSRLSKEELKKRQAEIAQKIVNLNVRSAEMTQEVNDWKALPPKKILASFISTLSPDDSL